MKVMCFTSRDDSTLP